MVCSNRLLYVPGLGEIIDEFLLQAKQAFGKFVPKLLLKEGAIIPDKLDHIEIFHILCTRSRRV
jgi:hypothetical protein